MKNFYNMSVLLEISHLICLFPVRMSTRKDKLIFKSNRNLYFVRIILLDSIMVSCILMNSYKILDSKINLKDIVFISCSFPIILVILEVQIVGYLNQTKFRKILLTLYSIQKYLSKSNKNQVDYLIIFQPLVIFCCFVYLFIVYFIYYNPDNALIINFGFTLSKFMIFTSSCIVVNFLRIIQGDFADLNNTLMVSNDFAFIFRVYLDLVFLCKKINKLFGRQLLLSMLIYFIWTIYEMYHLVILWSCNNCQRFLIMLAMSYTTIQESILFTIIWNCQNTKRESSRFKEIWYSRLTKKLDMFNQRTVQKYSLKLINHNVLFTAMGLYSLDMQQFFSMLGSLVTLIVILTQFSSTV